MGKLREKAVAKIEEYNATNERKVQQSEASILCVKSILSKQSFQDFQEDAEVDFSTDALVEIGIEAEKLKCYVNNAKTKVTRITLNGTKGPLHLDNDFFISKILEFLKAETAQYQVEGLKRKSGPKTRRSDIIIQCKGEIDVLKSIGVHDDFLSFVFNYESVEAFRKAISPGRTNPY
jgi:hypothetical protein